MPRTLSRRREAGSVTIEALVIIPILVILTLAVIDWALFLRDVSGATNIVRDASRTASTLPRVGMGDNFGHDGNDTPSFAWAASQDVPTSGLLVPANAITEMGVYLADENGFPEGSGGTLTCPPGTCVTYGWVPNPAFPDSSDIPGEFTFISGTWDPASIIACPGRAQSVGVYVKIDHTSFGFAPTREIAERSVARFEPLPSRPDQGILCEP